MALLSMCCVQDEGESVEVTGDPCLPTAYPMFVVSIQDVLAMTWLKPHQELLSSSSLYAFYQGMVVVFVSHQWVGLKYPDARLRQFKELQVVMKGLTENTIALDV